MKHFEFWNPRLFELPYYLYLLLGASIRGLSIKSLAKANYVLDHGEIGIGSKYQTQQAFEQKYFLPTVFIAAGSSDEAKQTLIEDFASMHGYPLILKSDVGSVGKGVVKLAGLEDVIKKIPSLEGAYILQKFTPLEKEYGVFYVRHYGEPRVTAINKKHFPTVVGDGKKNISQLSREHYRYTNHWHTFLQYLDVDRVPEAGESVLLSFIGSHTMGCKFTDDTYLLTPEVEQAIFRIFESQPGFNFGRLDVKAESEDAFLRGEFVVIEVNGVASLPTNMFDPDNSIWRAYEIFLQHGKYLLDAAYEHRHQPMKLDSYKSIIKKVRGNARMLDVSHKQLMDLGQSKNSS